MGRNRDQLLEKLQEQMCHLRTSIAAFYQGQFSESLRVATTLRILVHETGKSKALLPQLRSDGLELPILDSERELRPGDDEVFRYAIGIRVGPGVAVWPAVDLGSSHYSMTIIGAWWNRIVFRFHSRIGPQMTYRRKQVVLMLADREGGAHVDPNENPDYIRLLEHLPLGFSGNGIRIETPDLARFLTAQAGVEMLECLKRNFFPDEEVPLKWECGVPPPVATYIDHISGILRTVVPTTRTGEFLVTTRE